MNELLADLRRTALAYGLAAVLVVAGLSYWVGQRTGKQSLQVAALRDTVRITDSVAVTRTDTVVVRQRRVDTVRAVSDSLDALVAIIDDTTVGYRNPDSAQTELTPAVIPVYVVANLTALRNTVVAQDSLIISLYQRDTARVQQIAARDKLIARLKPPSKFGLTVGPGLVCSTRGCGLGAALTFSYRIGR